MNNDFLQSWKRGIWIGAIDSDGAAVFSLADNSENEANAALLRTGGTGTLAANY